MKRADQHFPFDVSRSTRKAATNNMNENILQIITPGSPVFAVFNERTDEKPITEQDLYLAPCPVVALVERRDGTKISTKQKYREVIGLYLENDGMTDPTSTDNFLGYASSKEDAAVKFLPLAPSATGAARPTIPQPRTAKGR